MSTKDCKRLFLLQLGYSQYLEERILLIKSLHFIFEGYSNSKCTNLF